MHDPEIHNALGLVTEAAVLISGRVLGNLCPELAARQTQWLIFRKVARPARAGELPYPPLPDRVTKSGYPAESVDFLKREKQGKMCRR